MADAGAIRSARAAVEIFADDTMLVRGLRAASVKLRNWAASVTRAGLYMASVGGVVAGTAVKLAHSWATAGASLLDVSQRTGLTTETLSELQYAARQTGTDIGSIEAITKRMQRNLTDAAAGSRMAADALARLGLNAADLVGKHPDEQFVTIAKALADIRDPTERAALAMQLLGRSGTAILPMLRRGGAEFDALRERARKLGLVIGREEAEAADNLDDAFTDLTLTVNRLLGAVGQALAPILGAVATQLADVAAWTRRVVREHGEAIVTVFKWSVGLFAAGKAMLLFGAALRAVGAVVGIVVSVVSAIGALPALIVTAGIGLLSLTDTGKRVSDSIKTSFGAVKDLVLDVWSALMTALGAGDVDAAVEVVKATCNLAWVEITNGFKLRWRQAWDYGLMVVTETIIAAKAAWAAVDFGRKSVGTWLEGKIGPEVITAGKQIAEHWRYAGATVGNVAKLLAVPFTSLKLKDVLTDFREAEKQFHADMTEAKDWLAQATSGPGAETTRDIMNKIRREFEANLAEYGKQAQEAETAATESNKHTLEELNKQREEALQRLDEAIDAARHAPERMEHKARAAAEAAAGVEVLQEPRAKRAVAEAASITTSIGAFSGAVASLLARAWPGQAKLLSAAEQTARNTRDIADQIDDIRAEFD